MRLSLLTLIAYGLSLAQGLALDPEITSVASGTTENVAVNGIEPILARGGKSGGSCPLFKLKRKGKNVKPKKAKKFKVTNNKRDVIVERGDVTPVDMGEIDSWTWQKGDIAYSAGFAGCSALVLYTNTAIVFAHINPEDEDDIRTPLAEIVAQAKELGVQGSSAKGRLYAHTDLPSRIQTEIVNYIQRKLAIRVSIKPYDAQSADDALDLVVSNDANGINFVFAKGAASRL
ncbi:hypothetical protein BU24DRAFT_411306 [Aaosphaeria arxii CBS 175.79]|uniref:Uncharacterized protein n=1 Tax=Aaosphaeria arxii CBS 175.79 TaxID=1450172 RepID=A0A6A5XL41_9PLEO|nr:uncharacterized protein BU24DRAFT_411306 [Aaosphaeria arxii CBS 175.79]KAF2013581.1 hypothetical protein BU24DRAFT_411306 [Aaosphaeria arxii CBS 175.79]